MDPKPASKSKTILTNLAGIVAAWAGFVSGAVGIDVAITTTVACATNIGLRFVTSTAIK